MSKALKFELYNWLREIRWWLHKFGEVELKWTRRQGNMVADELAKANFSVNVIFQSHRYIPRFFISSLT